MASSTRTHELGLERFFALLTALDWALEAFCQATGPLLPFETRAHAEALEAASRLKVHPRWLAFPVYGAGAKDVKPYGDEVAHLPPEELHARQRPRAPDRLHKAEGRNTVLYPVNPAHPNLVLPNEEDVYIWAASSGGAVEGGASDLLRKHLSYLAPRAAQGVVPAMLQIPYEAFVKPPQPK